MLDGMFIVLMLLVAVVSIAAGVSVGFVVGFALAAHPDILKGMQPRSKSRLLLWLCQRTEDLPLPQRLAFLACMLAWLPVFVGVVALPIGSARLLAPDYDWLPVASAVLFLAAAFTVRPVGRNSWRGLVGNLGE